jgi:hypothetical protein
LIVEIDWGDMDYGREDEEISSYLRRGHRMKD